MPVSPPSRPCLVGNCTLNCTSNRHEPTIIGEHDIARLHTEIMKQIYVGFDIHFSGMPNHYPFHLMH